tara:strand:- start:4 stop:414 length:411 start_codon:yes stop_codon:yes gene_type:complete
MKLSEIKEIKYLVGDDWKEAVISISLKKDDFEIENFRFIHQDKIDSIQQEELASDSYILGCFNANFLADILEIPQQDVEDLQKKGCFDALGYMVFKGGHLEELQKRYVEADSYGHHFAHYDHCEHEIGNYYAFRVN